MIGLRLVIELYAGYGVELTIGQLYAENEIEQSAHDTELHAQIELAESPTEQRNSLGFTPRTT